MESITTLLEKTRAVMKNVYAPYSKYHVGACIRSESNRYYAGCNIENVSYSLTLCAEACAISQMIAAGDRQIVEVLVMANSEIPCAPCGACRQRLWEFATAETKVHICNVQGLYKTVLLTELLPEAFDFRNLEKLPE